MRAFFWHERVLLKVWFHALRDHEDLPQNHAFEQGFSQAYTAYRKEQDVNEARKHIDQMIEQALDATQRGITPRQQVRYWFLAGLVAFCQRDWPSAAAWLSEAARIFDALPQLQRDWVAQAEMKHWLGIVLVQGHQHRQAIDSFDTLSVLLDTHGDPPFIQGNTQALRAELHMLRGKARMAQARFIESLEDSAACSTAIAHWLVAYGREQEWEELEYLADELSRHPTRDIRILLAPAFQKRQLSVQEYTLLQILEMHCQNIWLEALVLYWRVLTPPDSPIKEAADDLIRANQLLHDTIFLCERLPLLPYMLPHVLRAHADVAMAMSSFQWHHHHHSFNALSWLGAAQTSLNAAFALDPWLLPDGRYSDSPEIGLVTTISYYLLRYELASDIPALVDLRNYANGLRLYLWQKRMSYLSARCYTLIGEISDIIGTLLLHARATEAAQAEFDKARDALHQAEGIFRERDNALRLGEVQQLLSELPDPPPDDEEDPSS